MNLQIITLIISSSAFLLALYTFIKHDSIIKKQTKLINKSQIDKLEKENLANKKGVIEANLKNRDKGKRTIKIFNKGKSLAKNVEVKIIKEEGVIVLDYPKSIDLKPQNSFEINLFIADSSPDLLELEFTWNDEYKNGNFDNQTIQM